MDMNSVESLTRYLGEYVTLSRKKKIDSLLSKRTRQVAVVLEDVYQTHNTGAILRSCEGFGVQDVYSIQKRNEFVVNNNVAAGSSKWLDIFQYTNEKESSLATCSKALKEKGYSLVATSPHATMTLDQLPLDTKYAFFFGTEGNGLTKEAIDIADQLVSIPMYGFTESFNISVSVALTLYDITTRLRNSSIDWKLTEEEQILLKLDWMRNSVENADALERRFFHEHPEFEHE